MGIDRVEFGPGELVLGGGDYGAVTLDGATPQARVALDTIIGRSRLGSHITVDSVLFIVRDSETIVVEDRHAGTEGTPERGVGAADDASGAQDRAEESAGRGEDPRSEG